MADHQDSLPSFYIQENPSLLIKSIFSLIQMISEGATPDHKTHGCVDCGLKIFLVDFNNPERYEMLIQSGILEALVKLDISDKLIDRYVRLLLNWITAPDLTACLDERASVVLELCLSLKRLNMSTDTLIYVLSVRSLRYLAEKGKYELHFKCNMDTLTHVPLIVTDLRNRLVRNLVRCIIAPSCMESREDFLTDFRDFKVFSRILCREIRKSYPEDNYICEGKMDSLYDDFCVLLRTTDELLVLDLIEGGKINEKKLQHEWSLYLPILEELNFISKLYEGAEKQFWDLLRNKKASVRALIPRFAERTEAYDYEWLLEHNDVTDSESRMHLALVMIPQVKLQPSLELIQTLADWSQNLGIQLLGVVQNKKLTDPQVLEDWLCRSSEAIFNSRTNPLFLECSDDPTRFHMNHDKKPVAFHDDWPAPFHYDCAEFAGKVIALALIYKVRIGVAFDHGFLSLLKKERNDDDSSLVSFFVKGFTNVFGVSTKDLLSFKGLEDEDINEVLLHRSQNSNGMRKREADLDLLSQYQKVRILGRNIKTWQRSSELGRGSFGQVYKCLADQGFFFAAKKVQLVEAEKAKTVEHEIGLLCQFNHENIVEYFGTRKEDSELYIFLEFVNGGSLENVYKQFPLTDLQVSRYAKQILKGLKYLHERGVKHGDLKCANILLNKNGRVKIADFGLAKVTELGKLRKSGIGTPAWSAPEIIDPNRQKYKMQADIWSVGCCILEMLTGKYPYHGCMRFAAIYRIGNGVLPSIPDNLSTDSKDFIKDCLQVEPKERPTVAQLLEHAFVKKS